MCLWLSVSSYWVLYTGKYNSLWIMLQLLQMIYEYMMCTHLMEIFNCLDSLSSCCRFFASHKIKLWLSYLPKFTVNSHKTLKCTFQSTAYILCQVSSMLWIFHHAEQRVNAVLSFRYSVYPFSVLSQHGIKHPKPLPFFGNLFMFQQVT